MKHIIIIGASSGMGARLATDFARMGWRVGIAARRGALLEEIAGQFADRIVWRAFDASADDAPLQLQTLIDATGGMEVMLYAAGTGWGDPELDPEFTRRALDANIVGFTNMANAAYRYFRKHASRENPGQIAAISSIGGTKGIGTSAVYSASKSYQNKYLQALRQLAHRQNIPLAVTDIRPGFVDTALITGHRFPMTMTVNHAAPRIEKAILHRRKVAYIDWRWHIVAAVWSLAPDWAWRRFRFD